jgi:hypothetical protein
MGRKHAFRGTYAYGAIFSTTISNSLYHHAPRKRFGCRRVDRVPINIKFRWTLSTKKYELWLHWLPCLISVNLSDVSDVFTWSLTTSGTFSVKSMYADLMNGHTVFLHKHIWKIKVPPKIKIFVWFLHKKLILTKYNLAKRNRDDCKKCVFCDANESINPFGCPLSRLIWRTIQFTFSVLHQPML